MPGVRALPVLLALLCLASAVAALATPPADRVELANRYLRVVLTREAGRWTDSYEAKTADGWTPLLRAGHGLQPDPMLRADGADRIVHYGELRRLPDAGSGQEVELTARAGGVILKKRISLGATDPFAHVTVRARVSGRMALGRLLATYTAFPADSAGFRGIPPDFMYTPVLRPEPGDVIGDHVFRSPALMMQRGSRFVAVVPDPALMNTAHRRVQTGADVRLDGGATPLIAYGLMPWEVRWHVLYRHTDSMAVVVNDTVVSFGQYVFCSADAPAREGYRDVVRFLWERFGHAAFVAPGGPQHEAFSTYVHKAWDEYLPRVTLGATFKGKSVTLLRQARLAWSNTLPGDADNDCWFNVWFNALRTAYGMAFYGDRSGRSDLSRQAEGVLELALLAPQQGGIAPSIFYVDSTGNGHWVGDHAWGGIGKGEHLPMFHNAWTGVWLLQWASLRPERKEEILAFTGRFAHFLMTHQQESGVIPAWYAPETLTPAPELRDENAETAGAALFLAEYARTTGDPAALAAAERAMTYVFRDVLPEQKWFDYETFFSCSRKPPGFFDRFTGQHPQNTLSIHQASEACLSLFELTGKQEYLRRGEAILDYLSLYQQVWSPRWLSCELFGGFGVQNTDGEWSDSRQGYFAVTYMRYFGVTHKREYFERGVAALRSMFSLFESPTSPRTAENYAHGGRDALAGVTGLHWGTGSSVVSVHLITAQYGDVYIDAGGMWGAGVDGCRVQTVSVSGDRIRCALRDDVATPRVLRMVIGNTDRPKYRVTVNGKDLGSYDAGALRKGIHVEL